MLGWTVFSMDTEDGREHGPGAEFRDVKVFDAPGFDPIEGYGYPCVVRGPASALVAWLESEDPSVFRSPFVRDETDPAGFRVEAPEVRRQQCLDWARSLAADRRVVFEMWDQS